MPPIKRILLPTDFSPYSHVAAEHAFQLAGCFGAELHLLHVIQDPVMMYPDVALSVPPPMIDVRELESSAQKSLDRISIPEHISCTARTVRHGPEFLEIVRYAKENEIDMIVMGTHGRSGLSHALMGSVAEKVVRKAPCPVLTVRPEGHKFEMPF
ncbi:universal stress protein [Calycomorphotria hydatis]|uniref:Universal stress protein n=1 Tax=Calycomorphotria hydatis TaxID=2528027 RepID=A0A517TAZ3_9PLAN|nr:universal stress protein [Calycomorphotria hydatis]QDT65543.1 hypothetical protein V22_27980 [Calycomorphotria hydatis]